MSETAGRVKPVGDFNLDRFDDLLAELGPILGPRPAARVILDLRELTFIGPTCISLLLAACCSAPPGVITRVRPPSGNVRYYLERMDFFEMIPCETPRAAVGRRAPRGFRECMRFATLEDCEAGAPQVVEAIAERCDMDKSSRQALEICLEELAENCVFHAGEGQDGFATVQSWPKRALLEIGIVDLGRGIRASLVENPEHGDLATDLDAIRAATQLGVTATPERNSGQGLFFAGRLLAQNGGEVLIRSGSAQVYDGSRNEAGEVAVVLPGTAVALTINTDRPLDAAAVARLIGEEIDDTDELFD